MHYLLSFVFCYLPESLCHARLVTLELSYICLQRVQSQRDSSERGLPSRNVLPVGVDIRLWRWPQITEQARTASSWSI